MSPAAIEPATEPHKSGSRPREMTRQPLRSKDRAYDPHARPAEDLDMETINTVVAVYTTHSQAEEAIAAFKSISRRPDPGTR